MKWPGSNLAARFCSKVTPLALSKVLRPQKKLSPDREATYFQLSQAYRRVGRSAEAQLALAAYQKLIEANRLKKRESLEADKP